MAVQTRIQVRRDTAANWNSINPVLLAGEVGYETDTKYFKIGDGTTKWNGAAGDGVNKLAYQNTTGPTGATGAAGSNGRGYTGVTSTTSLSITVASKTLTVASTGAFLLGDRVRVINSATNYMEGTITALTTDSSITVNVENIGGTGTFASWTVSLTGLVGPSGAAQTGATGRGFDGITSTSSNTVTTGSKSFTVASSGAIVVGTRVRVVNTGTPTTYVEGAVTAVTIDSSITVNVDAVSGSGTITAWTFTVTGSIGAAGSNGTNGTNGSSGVGYDGVTSITSLSVGTGSKAVTVNKVGAYAVGSRIRVANTVTPANYMEGIITDITSLVITFTSDVVGGSGTFSAWTLSIAGNVGTTGGTGASGVISVTAPITNSGTSTAAQLGISAASTSAAGAVQLSDSVSTTSSVLGATSTAVKSAYDLAASALQRGGGTMTGKIVGATSTSSLAPFNVAPGVAVTTSLASGDFWNASGTLYLYNGSATKTLAFTDSAMTGTVNGVTFTGTNGKSLTVNNTLTLAGTDASTLNIGAGGTLGTGAFATIANYAPLSSPSFTTPSLGVATATSINKVGITSPATGSTLTIADGKTFTANNTLTFSGTDSSTLNIGTGGTLGTGAFATIANYAPLASPTFTGTVTAPTFSGSLTGAATKITTSGTVLNRTIFVSATQPASGMVTGDIWIQA